MSPYHHRTQALKAAFPYTIPIMTGFVFLGIAYGYFMTSEGFPPFYPIVISLTVYAGSMEFVAVGLLKRNVRPPAGAAADADDQRAAPVLRDIHAR